MTRIARPPKSFWFAHLIRATVGQLLLLVFRVKLIGGQNLPATGGVLLAGNHISYADPMLLWCKISRPTHFMAKSEAWESDFFGWGLDQFWAFPIRRGEADREAIGKATGYLAAGEPVAMFPEGTRNFEGTAQAQGGAAFIAMRAGVPILPVGIAGTDRIKPKGARLMRFPKVVISFGEPIDPATVLPDGGRKERVEALTTETMRRIGEELERARGVAGR